MVEASPKLFQRGLALYEERQDKEWGLTDCISFVTMRDRGIQEAPFFVPPLLVELESPPE